MEPSRSSVPRQGWQRWLLVLLGTGAVVATLLFMLGMGWLIVDALFGKQGPGEIPKIVGVLIFFVPVFMGSLLAGCLAGAAVAPFFLSRTDPIRPQAFALSGALILGVIVFVAYATRDFWWGGARTP